MKGRSIMRNILLIPLITPFRNGAIDIPSWRRLVGHYVKTGADGLVIAGTTGEGGALRQEETALLTMTAREVAGPGYPLWLGLSGNVTAQMVCKVEQANEWPVDGYLISTPYYNRPPEEGVIAFFETLHAASARDIVLYNIPYRTGFNLSNDGVRRLARLPRIVGIKDACAIAAQSVDLLLNRPPGFRVLTGEDRFYLTALRLGGDGGILASAHLRTADFIALAAALQNGDMTLAGRLWKGLVPLIDTVFAAPNPAPLKQALMVGGLIACAELRPPMMPVPADLAERIGKICQGGIL